MSIRNALIAVALVTTAQAVSAQQATSAPQGTFQEHVAPEMSIEHVIIPLKWVGGNWVAPFDLINTGGQFTPPPPPQQSEESDQPAPSGNLNNFIREADPSMFGTMIEGDVIPYKPEYLIIEPEGNFVIALREITFSDLGLTGENPLLVTSHFGFATAIPVEILEIHENEEGIAAMNNAYESSLDGGEIVGAIGLPFLQSFQAILDQNARTLTLKRKEFNEVQDQVIRAN